MISERNAGSATLVSLLAVCALGSGQASGAAADGCSLLPAADVSKAVGEAFSAPRESTAPRPFANTAEGTDCTFSSSKAGNQLLFRIYTDPSPAAAADLFARLGMFYSPQTPVAGLGEKAYLDPKHGLHVLIGKTRFFLAFDKVTPATDGQLKALAGLVIGRL